MYKVFTNNIENFKTKLKPIYIKSIENISFVIYENIKKYNFYEDSNYFVLLDGYIINNKDKTASKYILIQYLSNKLEKVNGIYNCIIYNKNNKNIYIINDKYGQKPLYYFYEKKNLIISSNIDLIIFGTENEIDWHSWIDFFSFGYVIGDKTYFKKIKRIRPASIININFNNNIFNILEYWDYNKIKIIDFNEKYFIKIFLLNAKNIFLETVKRTKDFCVNLSGGYDSRLILMLIKKFTNTKPVTFTSEKYPYDQEDKLKAKKIADNILYKNITIKLKPNLYKRNFLRKYLMVDFMTNYHIWIMELLDSYDKEYLNIDGYLGDAILGDTFIGTKNSKELFNNLLLKNSNITKIFNFINCKYFYKLAEENFKQELKLYKKYINPFYFFLFNVRARNCTSFYVFNILQKKVNEYLFFMDDRIISLCLSIPYNKRKNYYIYNKLMKLFNNKESRAHENLKNKIMKRIKLMMFKSMITRNLAFNLKRKYLYKYKKEDMDFLKEELSGFKIPEFFNKNVISNILKKANFDNSLYYHIE